MKISLTNSKLVKNKLGGGSHFGSINHLIVRADKHLCWHREATKAFIQNCPFWQEPALTNLAISYHHVLWLDTKLALPTKGAVQPAHSC